MPRPGRAFLQAAALDRRGDTLAACGHELRRYVQPPAELYRILADPPRVESSPNPAYDPAVFTCEVCGAQRPA